MRRLGALFALLLLVSLSTAAASSFSVTAEDNTSFSTAVSISVPTLTDTFYLTGSENQLPGRLSDTAVSDSAAVASKSISADPTTPIDQQTDPDEYHDWETLPFDQPLTIISPTVTLYIDQNGNRGPITAGLFECTTEWYEDELEDEIVVVDRACTVFSSASSTSSSPGEQTIVFPPFTKTIAASEDLPATDTLPERNLDQSLVLRVVNQAASGKWNIQWGYKLNRPAQLQFSTPVS